MNGFDLAILGVVLVFAIIGILRGFIKEVLSLTSWIVSFWVAFTFAETASYLFEPYIDAPLLRLVSAVAALFVCTLLLLTTHFAHMKLSLIPQGHSLVFPR